MLTRFAGSAHAEGTSGLTGRALPSCCAWLTMVSLKAVWQGAS
jgi:hypothetical protein